MLTIQTLPQTSADRRASVQLEGDFFIVQLLAGAPVVHVRARVPCECPQGTGRNCRHPCTLNKDAVGASDCCGGGGGWGSAVGENGGMLNTITSWDEGAAPGAAAGKSHTEGGLQAAVGKANGVAGERDEKHRGAVHRVLLADRWCGVCRRRNGQKK